MLLLLGAALALYSALHYEKPLAACIALSTFFPETRLADPDLFHNKGEGQGQVFMYIHIDSRRHIWSRQYLCFREMYVFQQPSVYF